MGKKRRNLTRAEFLAQRERKYQKVIRETGASTIYHVRHSCGHAVWWDDIDHALMARDFPCLWCGAETGIAPPPGEIACIKQGGHVRRDPNYRCPKHETADSLIIGRHLTDDSCCQGPGSVN